MVEKVKMSPRLYLFLIIFHFTTISVISAAENNRQKTGVSSVRCKNWKEVIAVMKYADSTTSYNFLVSRFGKSLDEYACPSLMEEYVVYFQVPGQQDSVFWVMLGTQTQKYLYWGMGKYFKDNCWIRNMDTIGITKKKIKQITGSQIGENVGDTIILSINRYDEQGRLVEESFPEQYCGTTYGYDSIGRISYEDLMCGESSGNGMTYYYYYDKKVCSHFSGAVYEYTTCDYLNERGKNFKSVRIWQEYGEGTTVIKTDTTVTTYNYLYDKKGRIVEEKIKYNPVNYKTIYYSYTDFDSLVSRIEIDTAGRILNRVVYNYEALTHRKTDEYRFTGDIMSWWKEPSLYSIITYYTHYVYKYNENGNLKSIWNYNFCSDKENSTEEKLTEIAVYNSGLKTESQLFDACSMYYTGIIFYTYEFW